MIPSCLVILVVTLSQDDGWRLQGDRLEDLRLEYRGPRPDLSSSGKAAEWILRMEFEWAYDERLDSRMQVLVRSAAQEILGPALTPNGFSQIYPEIDWKIKALKEHPDRFQPTIDLKSNGEKRDGDQTTLTYSIEITEHSPCSACKSTGRRQKEECRVCGGRGARTIPRTEARKVVLVLQEKEWRLRGIYETCFECKGMGSCVGCWGEKCPYCKGTKKCRHCEGTGDVPDDFLVLLKVEADLPSRPTEKPDLSSPETVFRSLAARNDLFHAESLRATIRRQRDIREVIEPFVARGAKLPEHVFVKPPAGEMELTINRLSDRRAVVRCKKTIASGYSVYVAEVLSDDKGAWKVEGQHAPCGDCQGTGGKGKCEPCGGKGFR